MGLGSKVKKLLSRGLKATGRWVFRKVFDPTGRFEKHPGLAVASGLTRFGSFLPGNIGRGFGLAHSGINTVANILDKLPGGKAKNTLTKAVMAPSTSDSGGTIKNVINGVRDGVGGVISAAKTIKKII